MSTSDMRRAHRELEERLRPFVSRRVPSCDVEDVLQEVFVRMQAALPALRNEDLLVPWLYRIAKSAIGDSHRRRLRAPRLEHDSEVLEEGSLGLDRESNEPSDLEQELSSYMVTFIAKVPSPYREALTLTEIEGLTQRAAADALGVSLSAMKTRVQRGREKLREELESCCRIATDARGRVIDCVPRDPSDCRCRGS
ncbi:MAG TPA: sigma-70 family RNA polymerase sigma factor [Polyangiaceae bacterium]|nr:sigma-70 family RNA polymerase sigma factor [Polyangiaceae bacterium]